MCIRDRGEGAEEVFAFLGRGEVWRTDVAGSGAFASDPAASGRGKWVARLDRFGTAIIADEFWGEAKHHRGLPFARVSHLGLVQGWVGVARFRAEAPIGRDQKKEVVAVAIALAQ